MTSISNQQRREIELGDIRLNPAVETPPLIVPTEVHLAGPRILWRDYESREVRPGAGVLDQFIELHSLNDDAILAYVRKWGPLGLCEHGLPASHADGYSRSMFYSPRQFAFCSPLMTEGGWFAEDLYHWRRFSRAAKAMLNVAAQLNAGDPDHLDEWECLFPASLPTPNVQMPRTRLQDVIQEWLDIGGVGTIFRWDLGNRWQLNVGSRGRAPLFGTLALKIMLAVSGEYGLGICSNCQQAYILSRRPNPNRWNYCEKCGTRAAWRNSKRKIRSGKNVAAAVLGALGGSKGGRARARSLSAETRSEIARKAAQARWGKSKASLSDTNADA